MCGTSLTQQLCRHTRPCLCPHISPSQVCSALLAYRCSRWAESGCSSGNGFKLSVKLRPNTVYVFIIVGMDIAPTLRFGITWATAAVAPLAAPQGAWSNARTIQGLPFTSPAFNVSPAPRQRLLSAKTHQPEYEPACPACKPEQTLTMGRPPHVSALQAFYKNTVPTDCNDLAVNTLSDGITQSTGPTRVFR